LVEQGRIEELRTRADVGDVPAIEQLARLLVEQGLIEELRIRPSAGDPYAAQALG
jgi:hypothetical protein